ncbi:MAG TPA: ABC transporter permease [Rariglobus sp.]
MRFLATCIIAIRALRRNKMRSVLTGLGIIIGVAAVIAIVSIGNGAKAQVEAQVASLGQNVISIFAGNYTTGGLRGGGGSAGTLTPEDAEAIAREIPDAVAVSPEVRDRAQVLANGLNWNTAITGEGPDYLSIRAWDLAEGAMFTEQDVRSVGKVCIIGKTIVDQLFPDGNPVGQSIRIRNIPFKVLGVLKGKGYNLFGQDQDDVVIVPYTSGMKRVSKRTNLNSILVQAISPEKMDKIQQDITDLLMQRRGGREPDFTVRNQIELAQAATATSKTMTLLLGIVAGVSLVVGGIGVMNIMLVSVTERTREIGIRLSIGAHDKDIRIQFLIEAMILSGLGGAIGVALGVGLSEVLAYLNGWNTAIPAWSIFAGLGGSALIGVVFGYFPASKASQLDPIEALRFE